jgi:hypothetical protein
MTVSRLILMAIPAALFVLFVRNNLTAEFWPGFAEPWQAIAAAFGLIETVAPRVLQFEPRPEQISFSHLLGQAVGSVAAVCVGVAQAILFLVAWHQCGPRTKKRRRGDDPL